MTDQSGQSIKSRRSSFIVAGVVISLLVAGAAAFALSGGGEDAPQADGEPTPLANASETAPSPSPTAIATITPSASPKPMPSSPKPSPTRTKTATKVVCAAAEELQIKLLAERMKFVSTADDPPTEAQKAQLITYVKKYSAQLRTQAERAADPKLAAALRKMADIVVAAIQEMFTVSKDQPQPKREAYDAANEIAARICGWPMSGL